MSTPPAAPATRHLRRVRLALAARVMAIGQAGQASAEYALVLLGAATVALLVTAWATHTDRIGGLLDAVVDRILAKAR